MKNSYAWIFIWIIAYLIGLFLDLPTVFACKGINIIGNEYYRYFTGLLLHVNMFHLLANCIGIYWVGRFLDGKVSDGKLFVFSIIAATIGNVLFSMYAKESVSIGGSLIVFALIGLIPVLQIFKPELPKFNPNSVNGSWILGYAILGNIPLFSGNMSTLVVHIISLGIGVIIGILGVFLKIF